MGLDAHGHRLVLNDGGLHQRGARAAAAAQHRAARQRRCFEHAQAGGGRGGGQAANVHGRAQRHVAVNGNAAVNWHDPLHLCDVMCGVS